MPSHQNIPFALGKSPYLFVFTSESLSVSERARFPARPFDLCGLAGGEFCVSLEHRATSPLFEWLDMIGDEWCLSEDNNVEEKEVIRDSCPLFSSYAPLGPEKAVPEQLSYAWYNALLGAA